MKAPYLVIKLTHTKSNMRKNKGKLMKILLISDVYFPRVNGVSTSIKTFATQLQALGHQVHLIAPEYGVITQDEAWITRVPSRQIFFDPEDRLMRYASVMELLPELRIQDFDIVHIHTPFVAHYAGLRIARELNRPVVETYHTFFEDYLHHYLPWIPKIFAKGLARIISKKQCNALDAIISPSNPMLDVLRNYGVTVHAEVIATGLQPASFADNEGAHFRKKYNIPINRPMLLYVGRVAHEKNIDFLLEVITVLRHQVPDVLLVITGEGPAEVHLRKQVNVHGIEQHVQFIGYLDRDKELGACYQAADIFVFASKSETQGLVLLEAMAQATPVVAIAELGTASILVEGQGARIAPDNKIGFAQIVHDLLKQPVERTILGNTGKAYVTQHWTAYSKAVQKVGFYQRLVRN